MSHSEASIFHGNQCLIAELKPVLEVLGISGWSLVMTGSMLGSIGVSAEVKKKS